MQHFKHFQKCQTFLQNEQRQTFSSRTKLEKKVNAYALF